MPKVFVKSCSIEDPSKTDSKELSSERGEKEEDVDLKQANVENIFSIYELLSNECEQGNSVILKSSSGLEMSQASSSRSTKVLINDENNSNQIRNTGNFPPQSLSNDAKINQNNLEISLHSKRLESEGTFRRRKDIFHTIIFNKPIKVSWINGLLNTPIISN